MTSIVLGSTFLPAIAQQIRQSLPEFAVHEIDLGTREQPAGDIRQSEPILRTADVIIPLRGYVSDQVLALAPSCRLIQQFGTGTDMVEIDAATRRRIPVCNVPARVGGNAESVAEMALFHMIGAGRELSRLQRLVATEDFSAPIGHALFRKTVCIVGFGNVGTVLARLLRPFSCHVIGIDNRAAAIRERSSRVVGGGSVQVWADGRLGEALAAADFVVVCVPLTPQTRGLLGPEQFKSMKVGARVVNISRGPTVDRDALLDGLRSGRVAAAGLDVFWEEPVSAADPILAENVIATPHCAGVTDHMVQQTSRIVADNIRRMLDGQRPKYRVDRSPSR